MSLLWQLMRIYKDYSQFKEINRCLGLDFLVLLQPLCNTCAQDKSKQLVTIEDLYDLELKENLQFMVVSIQSRFDTSRFDTNQSHFDTYLKSIRYNLHLPKL